MRPVVRGATPTNEDGEPVQYRDYKDARDDLIGRIGDYCSYCEVALHSQVDVEHVLPKNPNPSLEKLWDNFLLACGNCNSIKGDKEFGPDELYWPDRDNTSRAFTYRRDEPPEVSTDASVDQDRAERTIQLSGLDRLPGHPRYSDRDRRWLKRFNAWSLATEVADLIAANDTSEARELAIKVAIGHGFWSVWMAAFIGDQDMRSRLIQAFPGTSRESFNQDTTLSPRPGEIA